MTRGWHLFKLTAGWECALRNHYARVGSVWIVERGGWPYRWRVRREAH